MQAFERKWKLLQRTYFEQVQKVRHGCKDKAGTGFFKAVEL
jgi:hypothetical protein